MGAWRAIRAVVALAAAAVLLTGCGLNTVVNIRLWDDQTMFLDLDLSVPEGTEGAEDPKMVCTQLPQLGKLEPYLENGRAGCRVGGMVQADALNHISEDSKIAVENGELVLALTGLVVAPPGMEDQVDEELADASAQISVTFPGEVIDHSGASTVEGRTVTWTEMDDIQEGLHARSEMPNRLIVPIVVGSLCLVATIGVLVWSFRGRRPAVD